MTLEEAEYRDLAAAEKAKEWESVAPGTATRLIDEFAATRKHKRRLAWSHEVLEILKLICAFGCVALFVWLAKYFVDHDAATQGAAIVGVGLAALVTAFLGVMRTRTVVSQEG